VSPQKPLPNADNRCSKENYRAEDVWELSSCKMANYRSVLPCAAANYIEKLLPTIPSDVKPYYKASPLAYPWDYMREVRKSSLP
jgi:hypothetical protein